MVFFARFFAVAGLRAEYARFLLVVSLMEFVIDSGLQIKFVRLLKGVPGTDA